MPARPIDHESGVPLFRQVAADLRQRLRDGELRTGAPIPSEADLAYEYDLGRNTIRRALYQLHAEGYLVSQRGERWRAADPLPSEPDKRELVQLPPGARVWVEPATDEDRARHGLANGAVMVVVHHKAQTRRYPAIRTELQAPWRDPNGEPNHGQ